MRSNKKLPFCRCEGVSNGSSNKNFIIIGCYQRGWGGGGGVIRCFKAKVVPIKLVNVVRGLKKQ